nr:hypothetical protein [Tanacetum cinerariifolium]
ELINKRKPNIKFFFVFGCRCYLLNDYGDVGKLKANGDTGVFVGYLKESAAFRIYNKLTHKIHESVNVNFDEISKTASKQFSLKPGLSNLNETGKSSNRLVPKFDEASKKDLEDLFQDFYDGYFDSSKIMKSSTTNVETSNAEIPSHGEEVFHEVSESFQGESSSSLSNDDVQQSPKEVILPKTNTQSIPINMIPNGDEASTSHNVFNERLEDAYFDASSSFHDPSNVHTIYQPYPHEKKWTKDYPLHKISGDPKSTLKDADWVSAMQEELDQFTRLKVWRLVPRPEGKSVIKTKWIFKNKKDKSSLVIQNKARLVAVVPTPMVEQAKLKLDLVGKPVDHTDYRSMIGSLMYITLSRPDIMFATCMCARYQANPNDHHVSSVKRIFRYLKGTINLGLWYLKDSGFDLTAYSDADHAGCHLDRKSTSGSVQFLDYGFFYDKVPIYYDSKSAIAISCNPVQHTRIKHIDMRIYNKRTRKIHESVNVNFDEISEMASKHFSLEPGLSNLNETRKSSNPSVLNVDEASKKDLEDLFQDFSDEYFDSSKVMKSSTTNVETPINEEVFHEVSESFQEESSSSSLNDDVQQSPEEVILPSSNTRTKHINV